MYINSLFQHFLLWWFHVFKNIENILVDSDVFPKFILYFEFRYFSCTWNFEITPSDIIPDIVFLNQPSPPTFSSALIFNNFGGTTEGELERRKNKKGNIQDLQSPSSLFSQPTPKNIQYNPKINSKNLINTPFPPPTNPWFLLPPQSQLGELEKWGEAS